MKHICPHCNSENVQAFRVVFESGTSTAVHNTAGVGVGLGSSGSIGLGVGSAQTTSTSMTALAEKAAPPALKKIHWMIWGLLAAGVFVLFSAPGSEHGTELLKLLGVATFFVVLSVYLIVSIKKWNKTEYPRLMAEWERSWLCRSCGGTFNLK